MSSNILEVLKSRLDSLSRSERKVAEVIRIDPQSAIRSSIAALAKSADVSEPTVNRFCRSLDCSGFPDFKLRLAQCLATGTPYVSKNVEANDGVREFSSKIFQATINALNDTKRNLDVHEVERATDALAQARTITFIGLGASGPVAQDAQHKFFRLNTPVNFWVDIMSQRMAAAAAQRGDALVFISNTGRTIALVEAAELARNAGATVIAITHANTPLADKAHIVLDVDCSEDTEIYTPMTSRIVHLTLLDVLATGVLLRRGEDFHGHLRRVKESLSATRYADQHSKPEG